MRDHGKCDLGKACPYSHDTARIAASKASSKAGSGSGKGKGKGKGKAKDSKSQKGSATSVASSVKSGSSGDGLTREQKSKLTCTFLSHPKGCNRGNRCLFIHPGETTRANATTAPAAVCFEFGLPSTFPAASQSSIARGKF